MKHACAPGETKQTQNDEDNSYTPCLKTYLYVYFRGKKMSYTWFSLATNCSCNVFFHIKGYDYTDITARKTNKVMKIVYKFQFKETDRNFVISYL